MALVDRHSGGPCPVVIVVLSGPTRDDESAIEPATYGAFLLFVLGFATTGALIASRHPSNPVGWIAGAAAFLYTWAGLADGLVNRFPEFVTDGGPVVRLLFAIGESLWSVGLGLGATLLLLLFPNGRLPSPRWRTVAWMSATILLVIPLSLILTPGRVQDYPVENPLGIAGAGPALEAITGLAFVGFAITVPLCMASLFFRYRGASPIQRQQLKWLMFAAGLVAVIFFMSVVIEAVGRRSETSGEVSNFLTTAALSLIPLAIGMAILKHRLYDIDVIINRALVYGGLTAVLALAYVTIVFGLQQVLLPITRESDLAIAASTLTVAAMFRPLRGRVQEFIDGRFYRSKFNAQQTLESFGTRVRDEVDIHALTEQLLAVAYETMGAAHVSLWIRPRETP